MNHRRQCHAIRADIMWHGLLAISQTTWMWCEHFAYKSSIWKMRRIKMNTMRYTESPSSSYLECDVSILLISQDFRNWGKNLDRVFFKNISVTGKCLYLLLIITFVVLSSFILSSCLLKTILRTFSTCSKVPTNGRYHHWWFDVCKECMKVFIISYSPSFPSQLGSPFSL